MKTIGQICSYYYFRQTSITKVSVGIFVVILVQLNIKSGLMFFIYKGGLENDSDY